MRVIYNQGSQRISVVPIGRDGTPVVVDSGSDVTVSIQDLREPEDGSERFVLAETTVAQDTYSATLTGASGYSQADPHTIAVDASSAVLRRPYLLLGADGRGELVHLRSVNGSTAAQSLLPLRRNYAASDTIVGVELWATFPSATANDEDSVEANGGPYLVTWTYVSGGETIVLLTELWVDRCSIAPAIDEVFVLTAQPNLASRARTDVPDAIAAAWQDWLAEVQSSGRDPSLFPPSHTAKVAIRKLALAYLNRWVSGGESDNAYADSLESRAYEMFRDVLVDRAPQGQVELKRDSVDNVTQPKGHFFRLT